MSRSPHTILSLALLAALGASGSALAQVEAPRPHAVEEAEESREEAVEAAERAKLDAEAAAQAAQSARTVSENVPATTVEGELAARANAQVATEAARDAERAAREAERASQGARSGLNAARVGSDPPRAALEAEQAERATRAAGAAAASSAARAQMAADATLDAVSPPPPAPAAAPVAIAATQQVTVNSMPNDPIRANFLATDADGNGWIDRNEAAADAGLVAQFDRFDVDGDGRLSAAEYKEWRDWR